MFSGSNIQGNTRYTQDDTGSNTEGIYSGMAFIRPRGSANPVGRLNLAENLVKGSNSSSIVELQSRPQTGNTYFAQASSHGRRTASTAHFDKFIAKSGRNKEKN